MQKNKDVAHLLNKGVESTIPKGDLEKKLSSGKPLRVKYGIDPTSARLHIGHAIVFWKLREFQEQGHKIVLIVGDFTGRVGDASDKNAMRKQVSKTEIEKNMKDYKEQFGKILDMDQVEIRYNSEWLSKLSFEEVVALSQLFTVAQLIERDNFIERYKGGKPIGLHEFLYPLMQGYDSKVIEADVELGGSDQLFNMMAARKIQEHFKQIPQSVMTMQILNGLDGRKMSSSYDNCIFITDPPKEQYGKIMSMGDEMIISYFSLATDLSDEEIKSLTLSLKQGDNPKEIKERLAFEIVKRYYGDKKATRAAKEFENIFAKGGAPEDIETISVALSDGKGTAGEMNIIDLLEQAKLVPSRGEAKRLVEQGGVKIESKAISDISNTVNISQKKLVQVGKRRFVYVVMEKQ